MLAEPTRTPDRAATESSLQAAALNLLDRNGVLAGLNLREVADDAGVNRGLVYHYFGSRQDLLRAALRADVGRRFAEVAAAGALPLRERFTAFLKTMVHQRRALQLVTLLVLDRDRVLRVMPMRDTSHRLLERDVDDGLLDSDLDVDAVHAAAVSLVYGYVLYRERFAAEFDTGVTALDERVAAVFDRMLGGLAPR